MALVPLLPVDQDLVVLEVQDKDSLVAILVVVLLLLEATQVILEDRGTLRQATLGVEVLQERPDLATLVGGPILLLKGATLHMAIPKEDLEVTPPQVQVIPTDLQAVRWVLLEVTLLDRGVPHPHRVLQVTWLLFGENGVQTIVHAWRKKDASLHLSIQF